MKLSLWSGLAAAVLAVSVPAARAQAPAVVTADRVNVRSRPSVSSGEVVVQLARGQAVIVFEEGLPAAGVKEPVTEWTRIELPAGAPVWVASDHVVLPAGTVNVPRLNVRAGPSEDFAVLGTVAQGTVLRALEQRNGWLRIAAPLGLSGYVASSFLHLNDKPVPGEMTPPLASPPAQPAPAVPAAAAPATPPPSVSATAPAAATAPPATQAIPPAVAPATAASQPPAARPEPDEPAQKSATRETTPSAPPSTDESGKSAPGPDAVAEVPAPPAAEAVETSPIPRIVRREGIVRTTFSVQAPTPFELDAADNGRLLNYLLPQSTNVLIRPFRGQRVLVTGEEYLEPRWENAPVIVVHSVRLAP